MILIKIVATWISSIVLFSFLAWSLEQVTDQYNSGVKFLWRCCGAIVGIGLVIIPILVIVTIWR